MRKTTTWATILMFGITIMALAAEASESSSCPKTDIDCLEFAGLAEAGHFQAIIGKVDAKKIYSEQSRRYIGQAYLALAGDEKNTSVQEESFCRKALEFGSAQAYLCLYFLSADSDNVKALDFLRQYIATKPRDSLPYVILGEYELERNNYAQADAYLREAKKVSRANSPRVDWMLFQTTYLLGNYSEAAQLLDKAITSGRFEQELKKISTDVRFKELEKHPELKLPGARLR